MSFQPTKSQSNRKKSEALFTPPPATAGGPTEPFRCLGLATYESHEGERSLFVTNGDSLAAGADDSGGVAARLLLGMTAALAV